MASKPFTILIMLFGYACTAQAEKEAIDKEKTALTVDGSIQEKSDLNTAASNNHGHLYSDWGAYPYGNGGYGVSGYGTLDDKYNSNYGGYGGYDNNYSHGGYNRGGYPGYSGYAGNTGYGGSNKGYDGYGGYGSSGYGNGGYGGYEGYGGYGGYGGNGGNGGLTSYYGYNNPYYQGAYHLGFGYNKRTGYGNIYNSGITPSLVTGYRGYSRR